LQLSDYGKYESIMNTTRLIQQFRFTFPDDHHVDNFWQFEKILQKFGPMVSHLTLNGVLFDNELMQLLKYVPQCSDLHLEKIRVINTIDGHCQLKLPHPRHLSIEFAKTIRLGGFLSENNSSIEKFLRQFRLPDDCLRSVLFITRLNGEFDGLNMFLQNQTKIEEFKLIFNQATHVIPETFLSQCQLRKLIIWYNFSMNPLDSVLKSFENLRDRQMNLVESEILKVIKIK
jgi:hypothetical protein